MLILSIKNGSGLYHRLVLVGMLIFCSRLCFFCLALFKQSLHKITMVKADGQHCSQWKSTEFIMDCNQLGTLSKTGPASMNGGKIVALTFLRLECGLANKVHLISDTA